MADTWSDIGSFLTKALGSAGNALETGAAIAGQAEMNRGGPLSPFLGAALQVPAALREQSRQQASIAPSAATISSLSNNRISPEQARALVQSNPNASTSIIAELLKPQASTIKPPRRTYDAARGGIVNLDTGTFEPIPGVQPKATPPRSATLLNMYLAKNPNATPDEAGAFLAKFRPPPSAPAPTVEIATGLDGKPVIIDIPHTRAGGLGTPSLVPLPGGVTPGAPAKPKAGITPALRAAKLASYRTAYNKAKDSVSSIAVKTGFASPVPDFGAWLQQKYPEALTSLGITGTGVSKSTGQTVYKLNDGTWWAP